MSSASTDSMEASGGSSFSNRVRKRSKASEGPSTTASTPRPSLRTVPVSPSLLARTNTKGRNPTPWTVPLILNFSARIELFELTDMTDSPESFNRIFFQQLKLNYFETVEKRLPSQSHQASMPVPLVAETSINSMFGLTLRAYSLHFSTLKST